MTEPRLMNTLETLRVTFYGVVGRREGVDTITGCYCGSKNTIFSSAAIETIAMSTTCILLLYICSLCYKRVAATRTGCWDGLVVPGRPSLPSKDVLTRSRINKAIRRNLKIAELGALNRGVSEQLELLTEAIRAN